MKEMVNCENRLKNMLVLDKQEAPQKIDRLLKSELLFVFKNYFDICAEDLLLDISIDANGKYLISVNAESRNIKIAHLFSK